MSDTHRRPGRLVAVLAVLMAIDAPMPALADAADPPAEAPVAAVVTAVGPVTHLPLPRFVSLRGDNANARRGPSLDQRVDWTFLHRGMPLEVTAEYGNWRRVRDAEGQGGWVHHALLSGARTAVILGTERIELREEPGPAARVVAVAEPGVIGRLAACHDTWCEISANGSEGWLPRTALWGVGPDEMID
jgi:SH3-like domain-containing protein